MRAVPFLSGRDRLLAAFCALLLLPPGGTASAHSKDLDAAVSALVER